MKCYVKYYIQKIFLKLLFYLVAPIRMFRSGKWIAIYRPDHLGDILCSLPAMQRIIQYAREQHFRILLIVSPEYEWIVSPLLNLELDNLFPIQRMRTYTDKIYRLKIFLILYLYKIRKMISFLDTDPTGYIPAFSFARESFCFDFQRPNKPIWQIFFEAQFTKMYVINIKESVFQQYMRYVEFITQNKTTETILLPDFNSLFPDIGQKSFLTEHYFLVFPGASVYCNCWDAEKYAEVCNHIFAQNSRIKCVIMGSSKDIIFEKVMLEHSAYINRMLPLCGKTTLQECFAWCRNAQFVLGNDSGGGHLAAYYHIPSFLIIHGADFGHYMPNSVYKNTTFIFQQKDCFTCKGVCLFIKQTVDGAIRWPCLDAVSANDVIQAIKEKGFIN